MLWRKAKPPEVITYRVKVDGPPMGDPNNIETWMQLAGAFTEAPGLQQSITADFQDTMEAMEKLPADSHGERIRLSQKACDLWRFLNIPKAAVAMADKLLAAQQAERTEPPKVPPGLKVEM